MEDTTASSSGTSCLEKLTDYAKTPKGFILSAEILLSLIIIICYGVSHPGGYLYLAVGKMIFTMVIFFIFMMEMDKQFLSVNWLWTDLFRAGIGAVHYLIFSLIHVIGGARAGAYFAGGVFGLIAGLVFAYDTYTICLEIKSTRQQTAASTNNRV